MLKTYLYKDLSRQAIQKLISRNNDEDKVIRERVEDIIHQVKLQGDAALLNLTERFDQVKLRSLFIEKKEISKLSEGISDAAKQAIDTAYYNIRKFHLSQAQQEEKVETMSGVTCWRENRPIEKIGLYIPGGTAVLPSTFLMLGIPARIAGCKEIIVCSPPQKDEKVNPYIAYVAQRLEIERIYLIGGAQAVAAMAYGTASIPKVDKIFGPGNQYVTRAKNMIQATTATAIDMPAGPSEVLIIADETANPVFVAADLLAQAEHGTDSQVVLVTTSEKIIEQTLTALEKQLNIIPRKSIAAQSIKNSHALVVDTIEEAIAFSNEYAPEHLILQMANWQTCIEKITNAGSVFLGHHTPESAGDYASGTNHTLPTGGYARSYSGVSVDSFVKKITFQHITEKGIQNIGPTVETLATLEGLEAHKNAVTVRLKN